MQVRVVDALTAVPAPAWNGLRGTDNPFLRHEFLSALEETGSVTPATGWQPCHLLLEDGGRLLAAAPAYIKSHSWGEFVFDWLWADAYDRQGLDYYPKLICAVPHSPVTGPRVLVAPDQDEPQAIGYLAAAARELVARAGLSSAHWLFPEESQAERLAEHGYGRRLGMQYHWQNRGYRDFDDFLAGFSSKKRKNVRQERRTVAAAGIEFEVLHGDALSESDWDALYRFYSDTFRAHGNLPTLSHECFRRIGREMPREVVVIFGRMQGDPVAAAFCLRSSDTLYGRYWGSGIELGGLHFETCYYQGIEYCIREGLARFEPGAGGEHKLARGFLPTPTWSAHYLRDATMAAAVNDFLNREADAVRAQMHEMSRHGPFRIES